MTSNRLFVLFLGVVSLFPVLQSRAADETVPRNAKYEVELKDEGRYKVPADGRVWLWDVDDKNLIHSTNVREGDTYAFNSHEDRVYINNREIDGKTSMDNGHAYRIYFLATEKRAERVREHNNVPDTAKLVMEGRDKELSYKADADGTAYLWDNTNNTLIETFNLHPDDRLTISPKSNAMAVNGKTVSRDIELSRRVEYRLLFDLKK